MKKTKRLILLAAAAISFQFVSAQVRSQDSMIHKIFATLKAKDEKAFIALYPNRLGRHQVLNFRLFLPMRETLLQTSRLHRAETSLYQNSFDSRCQLI